MAEENADLVEVDVEVAASFYSWDYFANLSSPGALDYSVCSNTSHLEDNDLIIVEAALNYILKSSPDFAFIYLERTDVVGHQSGYMSKLYLAAIQTADKAVGLLLERLGKSQLHDRYSIILHSDHGGSGFLHESNTPEVMTVPWIACGPNIKPGYTISGDVSLLDTAPTVAHLLDVRPHHTWQGKVSEEIFIL